MRTVLVALLAFVLAGAAPAAAPPPARILFQTFPYLGTDTPYGLGVANADGSGFVDLTASLVRNHHAVLEAAWSPDGSKLAFSRLRTNPNGSDVTAGDIYVVDADGGHAHRLTVDGGTRVSNEHPTWSPDGTRLAWLKVRPNGSDVWTMRAGGSAKRAVTTDGTRRVVNTGVAWSADGRRLGWLKRRGYPDIPGPPGNVWLASADGSGARALTTSGQVVRGPFWQPHGTLLLYDEGQYDTTLHVVDPAEGPPGVTIVTSGFLFPATEPYGSAPVWSPRGDQFAWGDSNGVVTSTPRGSGRRIAITTAYNVSWAPDGSKLAFAHEQVLPPVAGGECECANVYVVGVNGGRPRNVSGREGVRGASWWESLWWPDSKRLTIGDEASIVNVNADGTCRRPFPSGLTTSRSGPLLWQPGVRALPPYPRCGQH